MNSFQKLYLGNLVLFGLNELISQNGNTSCDVEWNGVASGSIDRTSGSGSFSSRASKLSGSGISVIAAGITSDSQVINSTKYISKVYQWVVKSNFGNFS